MRLLLDTHTLIWWSGDEHFIPRPTHGAIHEAEQVWVSAVSAYEISLKFQSGRLPKAAPLLQDLPSYLRSQQFRELVITTVHARRAGALPLVHRDPWDRLLAAQALVEDLTIVSADDKLDQFGVRRLW